MHFFAQRALFYFNFIESGAKNTTYICNRDKGIRVYIMNQTKDQRTLRFAHKNGNDFYGFLRIPSCSVQYSHSTIDGGIDGGSNLFVFGRINKEVDGSMEPCHQPIDRDGIGDRHRHTIKHAFDLKIDRISPLRQHRLGQPAGRTPRR